MNDGKPATKETVWRRKNLPRNSRKLPVLLRPVHYDKLQKLRKIDRIGRNEPLAAVIERLIDQAELLPPRRLEISLRSKAA